MHERSPLTLSVLLTAHDQPLQLQRCIDSLAGSPLRYAELVVLDDGSDPPAEIHARNLRMPITTMRNVRPRGQAASRNSAASAALGDVLIFLATDSCVAPDTLGAVERAFSGDPLLGAVLGPARGRELDPSEAPMHLFECGLFAVRQYLFREHGGFSERCLADGTLDFVLRLAHSGVRMMVRDNTAVSVQAPETLATTLRSAYRNGILWEQLREHRVGLEEAMPWCTLRDARLGAAPLTWRSAWKHELRQHAAEMAFHAGTAACRLHEFSQMAARPLRGQVITMPQGKREMRDALLRRMGYEI
jgi:cellulose synthase/poly-beta-1,6-N-acetylglucosamine synthase-like glycosyltransferase